ncbi:MAG: YIP1 family protein [Atribacterota bacterium]|nr:YIP1 family protein [Atribacterota bacterium]
MKEAIRFALHITVRPFDGFWDMKYEKKGRFGVAIAIVLFVVLADIFDIIAGGFLYNNSYQLPVNLFRQLRVIVLPYILFCVANWSVTTLMDGEGTMKDIMMATGYALMPMILIPVPLTVIGNFLSYDERAYFNALLSFSTVWTGFLIFSGIMTVHQYSAMKTVMTLLATIVAMGVIVFIGMVFMSLTNQLVGFIYSIYKEVMLRI